MNDQNQLNNPTSDNAPIAMRTPPQYTNPHHSQTGVVLGILIVLLVIILGGLYLWGASLSKESALPTVPEIINDEPETPRADADVQMLKTVSPSDELDAIEADLESTNLDILGTEIDTLDNELNSGL